MGQKLVSVSAVQTETGTINVFAVDEVGKLWLGYKHVNGTWIWEPVKAPEN